MRVKVRRLDKDDRYWLKCEICGKEWDCSEETSLLYHWICPDRCNLDWLNYLFNIKRTNTRQTED